MSAKPGRDSDYCLMQSPEHAEEMAEARRLGGLRRRREVAVSGAYELNGLETVADLRRLLLIAALDALGLENSIVRSRMPRRGVDRYLPRHASRRAADHGSRGNSVQGSVL